MFNDLNIEPVNFSKLNPPTYFVTNEFTEVSQQIINTYGIPTYGEVNPAIIANVTFPFLFGVMFGDIGHGFILLLAGTYLCMFSESLSENPDNILMLKFRYYLVLMGFFATYMGLIYNDFMSIPLSLFGKSCYSEVNGKNERSKDCVYPFGLDPIWMSSENDIIYYNSFKMKTSVVLGIAHMTIGIALKGVNALHFNNQWDLYHEVIPQALLLLGLFGFMDLLII